MSTHKLNIWDFKKHKTLRGEYTGFFNGMGKFRSTIFHVREQKSRKMTSLWGHYQVKLFFAELPFGTLVEIRCLGLKFEKPKKGSKDKKGKKFFDYKFKVLKRPPLTQNFVKPINKGWKNINGEKRKRGAATGRRDIAKRRGEAREPSYG